MTDGPSSNSLTLESTLVVEAHSLDGSPLTVPTATRLRFTGTFGPTLWGRPGADRNRTSVTAMVSLLLNGSPFASTLQSTILIEQTLAPLLAVLFSVRLGVTQRIELTVRLATACADPLENSVTLKLAIPTALLRNSTTPRGPTLWRITLYLRVRRKVPKTRVARRTVLPYLTTFRRLTHLPRATLLTHLTMTHRTTLLKSILHIPITPGRESTVTVPDLPPKWWTNLLPPRHLLPRTPMVILWLLIALA